MAISNLCMCASVFAQRKIIEYAIERNELYMYTM